jgi:5,10-methylenetetrahydrofolate reductase
MHISEKLNQAQKTGKPGFSFEFFPPKTAQVGLLCSNIDRF